MRILRDASEEEFEGQVFREERRGLRYFRKEQHMFHYRCHMHCMSLYVKKGVQAYFKREERTKHYADTRMVEKV